MEEKSVYLEKHYGIKQLAEDDRPREKLTLRGRQYLSNAELLALLIGFGTSEFSAIDLGKQVLQLAGNNLNELAKLKVSDLKKVKGIGEAKAVSLVAALELGRRRKEEAAKEVVKITSSSEAVMQFEHILEDLPHEEFWVLLLSRNNHIIGKQRISVGGVSGTVVDPKIIFKCAIDAVASGIVLCHNHPSGSISPSSQDLKLTKKLIEGGRLLEIYIGDHIIIGHKKYYSFADDGLIYR